MLRIIKLLPVLSFLFLSKLSGGQTPSEKLKLLIESLSGHFDNEEQSLTDRSYFDIQMNTARIWKYKKDGYWLYEEHALADQLNVPYRQRVYHVYQQDSVFIYEVYTIANSRRFAGAYKFKKALNELRNDALHIKPGCEVYLVYDSGKFIGKTRDRICASDIGGAAYATSDVEITTAEIRIWDRGFNERGEQVWGPVKGPYIFDRINKIK